MKLLRLSTSSLLLLVLFLAACGQRKRQLHILTFRDYVDPKVVKSFEQAFDCKVSLAFVDNGDSIEAKIAAGGARTCDIVTTSDVLSLSRLGLLAQLHVESIANLKNIDPRFDAVSFDHGVRYSIPYSWGAMGLYVRDDPDRPVEESWSLIFDAARQHGSFYLLNDYSTSIGAALRYRGHSINSTNLEELAEARELLLEARKRAAGFIDVTATNHRILSRDASTTMACSGEAYEGCREDSGTRFFIPREGSCMVLDGFGILAKAPQRDLAESFLNYILDARIGAQLANYLHCATPNRAALEFILPEDLKNPAIYPPPDLMSRLEIGRDLGEGTKLRAELWTQVKSK